MEPEENEFICRLDVVASTGGQVSIPMSLVYFRSWDIVGEAKFLTQNGSRAQSLPSIASVLYLYFRQYDIQTWPLNHRKKSTFYEINVQKFLLQTQAFDNGTIPFLLGI